MTRYVFKMPDLGEGTVEAEVVAWHIKVGDMVQEDQVMAEVMTDKAAVEVPAPVSGKVVTINGQPGDMVRVGSELVVFETAAGDDDAVAPAPADMAPAKQPAAEPEKFVAPPAAPVAVPASAPVPTPAVSSTAPTDAGEASGRVKASPATRRKAREAGVDLRQVAGSGPSGRILPKDFEAAFSGATLAATNGSGKATAPSTLRQRTGVDEVKVIGVRRVIAQRMTDAARTIPHFSYVERSTSPSSSPCART